MQARMCKALLNLALVAATLALASAAGGSDYDRTKPVPC